MGSIMNERPNLCSPPPPLPVDHGAVLARYREPDLGQSVQQLLSSVIPFCMLWALMTCLEKLILRGCRNFSDAGLKNLRELTNLALLNLWGDAHHGFRVGKSGRAG